MTPQNRPVFRADIHYARFEHIGLSTLILSFPAVQALTNTPGGQEPAPNSTRSSIPAPECAGVRLNFTRIFASLVEAGSQVTREDQRRDRQRL